MIKTGSAFSGVGFWEMALKYLGIEYKHQFCIEYDKYPYASYKAIHGEVKNYGNITKVDGPEVENIDLFVYSPPCQAFSVAGKQIEELSKSVMLQDKIIAQQSIIEDRQEIYHRE